jgi:hypothetical protein
MDAKARRAQLARFGRDASSPTDGPGVVHRKAVLAGAPTRLPARPAREVELSPHARQPKRNSGRAFRAKARAVAFDAAKRVGAGTVTFAHPGCEGHERCKSTCVTYG